jgi:branched-subunit amino acid ABC-type transport system permease component
MFLLPYLVDGLLIGCVYGIAAMGMTLIWGVMDVINLAHGALIALGSFAVFLLATSTGLNPYLAIVVSGAAGLAAGIIIYRLAIQRVIGASSLSTLLSTFAINMILIGVATAIFTTTPRALDVQLGSLAFGPVTVQVTRLVAALLSILLAAGLYFFLYNTTLGRYIRAVSNNRGAAELVGIPSQRVLAFSFGLGSLLAVAAGGLIATFFPFTILSGSTYELKSFVIGVLGGLGHPLGALVGGLILGLIEGLVPAFLPVTWTPVLEFILFIIILLFLPQGIFGVKR